MACGQLHLPTPKRRDEELACAVTVRTLGIRMTGD